MKKFLLIPACALLALSACTSDKTTESQPSTTDQGAVAGPLPEPANSPAAASTSSTPASSASTSDAPAKPSSSSNSSQPMAQPTATAQPSTDYPKGIPVAGKKGYVLSPYAQYAGLVDVNGFPSGSIVSCPYTHKKFIVP